MDKTLIKRDRRIAERAVDRLSDLQADRVQSESRADAVQFLRGYVTRIRRMAYRQAIADAAEVASMAASADDAARAISKLAKERT